MSGDKQIEEIANTYYEAMLKARGTLGSMNEGAPKWYAKAFYNAGYRKASDILDEAYEILKELKDEYRRNEETREACAVRNAMFKLAELKDKYTEGGE